MTYTLKNTVEIEGKGLHSGEKSRLRLHPAEQDITFHQSGSRFPAHWRFVKSTLRSTLLGNKEFHINTVEHLMSALWGAAVVACDIEVMEGSEVPALDGSAKPFYEWIQSAGLQPLEYSAPLIPTLTVQHDEKVMAIQPGDQTAFGYIHFPPPLGVESGIFDLRLYAQEIMPARTFGFLHEVEALRAAGLAQGADLDNALVIDEQGWHNAPRFPDEPLRHKILDALGDLYLCGYYLRDFHLTALKHGHTLGVELAKQVDLAIATYK